MAGGELGLLAAAFVRAGLWVASGHVNIRWRR